ncbi:MAG: endonuclease MutS2 [Candidatus Auribacterota bacterium]
MDSHTLSILELHSVTRLIADCTQSGMGKAFIYNLAPTTDHAQIATRLAVTSELMDLITDGLNVPAHSADDISDMLDQMHIEGTILDSEGFMLLWALLHQSRMIKKFITACEKDIPSLKALAHKIPDQPRLEKAIAYVFNEDGKVRDRASSRLRSIRKDIKSLRNSILNKITHIVDNKRATGCLSNDQVTIREGRYVLFVKSEMRHHIDGVIHDKSMSGSTCFIEPASVIESGNRLRSLKFDERNEIMRIKRFLSEMVREELDSLKQMITPIQEYEAMRATAVFAVKNGFICPDIAADMNLVIRNGRHPILLYRLKQDTIPLSVELSSDKRALVITGPNMGGKTVALKTVGLLCLMVQCGLPVPVAEGSRFPVFSTIFADIGDEQSLENDMSTFSSHIVRIKDILHNCPDGQKSLVLLDEFGTGTDPAEGAALAIAILEQMMERGIFAIANTHLYQLKLFASQHKGVRNASMLYDDTLNRPTYRLVMDIPGSSNAMNIAKNLGLPSNILYHAQKLLGKTPGELDTLIRQLHDQKIALVDEKRILDEEREKYAILMRRYKAKVLQFEDEKKDIITKKLNEMDETIKTMKKDFETAVSSLNAPNHEQVHTVRKKLESYHKEVKIQKQELLIEDRQQEIETPHINMDWQKGDTAVVAPFMLEGTILSINTKKKKVTVLCDNQRIETSLASLQPAKEKQKKPPADSKTTVSFHVAQERKGSFNPTLDLRGHTVDESLSMLEQHLSDVVMFGFKMFTVIHGFGTGKVKRAVQDYLAEQREVKHFRDGQQGEGGLGVTVVEIG